MKKTYSIMLSFILIVLAIIPAIYAEDYFNIKDLAQNTPKEWRQTYQAYGRTIEIDTEIKIPDVEAAPILKVSQRKPFEGKELEHWLNVFGVDSNEGIRRDSTGKYWYFFGSDEDRTVFDFNCPAANEDIGETWQKISEPEDALLAYDINEAYAPRNDLTIAQALDIAKQRTREVMGEEVDFVLDTVALKGYYDRKTHKPIRKVDGYYFQCMPVMEGIPCIKTTITGDYWKNSKIFASIFSADSYSIMCSLFNKDEVLVQDIPLCSFEKIKTSIESLIMNGRIRKIYKVRLVYGTFYDKDKGFVMVPVWNADCEIHLDAKKKRMSLIRKDLSMKCLATDQ